LILHAVNEGDARGGSPAADQSYSYTAPFRIRPFACGWTRKTVQRELKVQRAAHGAVCFTDKRQVQHEEHDLVIEALLGDLGCDFCVLVRACSINALRIF
jgi:hypothetical protein